MKCKKCKKKIDFDKTSSEKGHNIFWKNNRIVAVDGICIDCYGDYNGQM